MSDPSIQGPGWYFAEGDPPGTKRYWDGNTWTEGPRMMQDGAEPAPMGAGAPMAAAAGSAMPAAAMGDRVLAWLIDFGVMIGLFIVLGIITAIIGAVSSTLGTIVSLVGYLLLLGVAIYLFAWGQGETGQTPGKRVMGMKMVDAATGQNIGGGKGIARWFVSGILNSILCGIPVSSLWAFADKENDALHDKVMKTKVTPTEKGSFMPLFPNGNPF